MKLTKVEKETIILFNEADKEAHIQTYNAGLRKRLEAFSKKHPDLCRLDMSMGQGGVCYYIQQSGQMMWQYGAVCSQNIGSVPDVLTVT